MTGGRIFEIPIASKSKTLMTTTNSKQIKEIQADKKRLLDEIKALDEQENALKKYNGFELGDWVHYKMDNFTYQIAGFGVCKYSHDTYAESSPHSQLKAIFLRALKPATDEQIIRVLEQRAKDAGIVVGAKYELRDSGSIHKISSIQMAGSLSSLDNYHKSGNTDNFFRKNGWVIGIREGCYVYSPDEIKIIKEEPLPEINGYKGTYDGEVFTYGCATIDKSLIKDAYHLATGIHNTFYKGNRSINEVQIKLDSGVTLTWDAIYGLYKVIEERKS